MPFSEGDIIYSEGYHDEFHQYLWNRLLWDPNRSLDEVTLKYCRYYFGEDTAAKSKSEKHRLLAAIAAYRPSEKSGPVLKK